MTVAYYWFQGITKPKLRRVNKIYKFVFAVLGDIRGGEDSSGIWNYIDGSYVVISKTICHRMTEI